jgi:hypothetical protein
MINVKVKLLLCLTKHNAMKTYLGVELQRHAFLTSTPDGGDLSASWPSRFTVGYRASLDAVYKSKITSFCRTPIVQPLTSLYADWATPALEVVPVLN